MRNVVATGYYQDTEENAIFKIEIIQEEEGLNPIKDCDIGFEMYCWHNSYNLGTENPFSDPEDFEEYAKDKDCVALPLWLYDHSGITMSCGNANPFSCRWDSGQVGYAYMDYDMAKKWFLEKDLENWHERAEKYIKAVVRDYALYLEGRCYGYQTFVYNEFEEEFEDDSADSCWGFISDKFGIDLVEEIAKWDITSETIYETLDELIEKESTKLPTKLQKLEYERDQIEIRIANLNDILEKKNAEIEAERMVMA